LSARAQIYRAHVPLDKLAAAGQAPPLLLALRLHVVVLSPAPHDTALPARLASRASEAFASAGLATQVAASATADSPDGCTTADAPHGGPAFHAPPLADHWPCGLSSVAWASLTDAEVDTLLQVRTFVGLLGLARDAALPREAPSALTAHTLAVCRRRRGWAMP
jgi:hypothetical protein